MSGHTQTLAALSFRQQPQLRVHQQHHGQLYVAVGGVAHLPHCKRGCCRDRARVPAAGESESCVAAAGGTQQQGRACLGVHPAARVTTPAELSIAPLSDVSQCIRTCPPGAPAPLTYSIDFVRRCQSTRSRRPRRWTTASITCATKRRAPSDPISSSAPPALSMIASPPLRAACTPRKCASCLVQGHFLSPRAEP
jgi:hypothetical protein